MQLLHKILRKGEKKQRNERRAAKDVTTAPLLCVTERDGEWWRCRNSDRAHVCERVHMLQWVINFGIFGGNKNCFFSIIIRKICLSKRNAKRVWTAFSSRFRCRWGRQCSGWQSEWFLWCAPTHFCYWSRAFGMSNVPLRVICAMCLIPSVCALTFFFLLFFSFNGFLHVISKISRYCVRRGRAAYTFRLLHFGSISAGTNANVMLIAHTQPPQK